MPTSTLIYKKGVRYLDYEKYEAERIAYFEGRKAAIIAAIGYEKRRLYKINRRAEKVYRKFSGQKVGHREQLRRRLEIIDIRRYNVKTKISNLRLEYESLILMQCGVPLNFIDNSLTYIKDDERHILLGYFAKDIGIEHHGHMIVTTDNKLRYVRFPGEEHGYLYHIRPPITPFEFFNKFANFKRITALRDAGIDFNEVEAKLACSGA